ncbi:MAG: SusC/RagA family TonB-linked outer membrane protein [Bacteroidales bacterium]|nr:SusC/RagA family TonB-linked outer membrane protein [Bacteroidales bacterium]
MKKLTIFLAFLLFVGFTVQAQMQISGTVTGAEDGLPIPGVSVVVKDNTTIGTTTDIDGKYSLTIPSSAQALIFSFVGMKSQEVLINGRSVIDIKIEAEFLEMDEVVVTALGIKREKREVTYQTQKVSDSELNRMAPTKAGAAMAGKVAGLQINVQDNGVNPSTQIILRGLRSISFDNQALIVIDGSIATSSAFDNLNPNDIENISVLKGATAAALYGSRAGNGVLIVNTKTGEAGQKFIVGINSAYTLEQVAYMPKFQNEYGTGWEGAYDNVENTNWGPRFDGTLRQIGPTMPEGYPVETQMVPYAPVKDNLLDFFETGDTWNNTIYLSGSNETSKFYASFGDQRSSGIVMNDEYRRNTVRVNASKKVGKVEVGVTSSFFTDYQNVVGSTIGDQDRPLYWFLLNTSANIPLSTYKDWSNPLSYGYADNYYNAYYQNPYWAVGTNRNIDYTNRLIGNLNLSYDVFEWLNFTGRIGLNNIWGDGKNWRAEQNYNADLQPSHSHVSSFVEETEYSRGTYTGDALLTGNFSFLDNFTLKAILGGTIYSTDYKWNFVRADNLSIPGFYDVSNGTGSPTVQVDEEKNRNFGFFGDFTLGFKNYVFLNFSGRNDWTSTLSEGNNSYFYPAVGLSFVATDAIDMLKNNNVLSFAKVTLSNSTVYNDLPAYRTNEVFSKHVSFPYGDINGFLLQTGAVDPDITKEKLNTTELGLNLGFFQSRISLDFSYFKTMINDLIVATTPSITSGAGSYLTNIGELESNGIELSLSGNVINYRDFKWDLNFNYTHNSTIVNEIYEGLDEIAVVAQTEIPIGVYAVVGEEYPQMKSNVYERDPQGRIVIDPATGWPKVLEAQAMMGRTTPPHIYGLSTTLSYKGFAVSATFDYRTGHVYYEQGSQQMEFTGRSLASVSANRQDFVIPNSVIDNGTEYVPNTNIQVQNGRQTYWTDVYNAVGENYVKDATALKFRELSVSYDIPKKYIQKLSLNKVTIGFIGRNLMTWLPEENCFADPEFNNSTANNFNAIGVGGYFQSPPTKSYGFNINIEF